MQREVPGGQEPRPFPRGLLHYHLALENVIMSMLANTTYSYLCHYYSNGESVKDAILITRVHTADAISLPNKRGTHQPDIQGIP